MRVEMAALDWIVIAAFLAASLGVGLWFTRRAGKSLDDYFLSGRDLPWWALGTSMIATSFASDTPLIVAGMVLKEGTALNWSWWNFLVGGTLTVFVFSRWWRRAEITTEVELIALRYDGRAARLLRGFKALYLGLLLNAIVFGWVTKAMVKVLRVVLPAEGPLASETTAIGLLVAMTLGYTALSGLWGVVATDVFQFIVAMAGAVLVAWLGAAECGGMTELLARVRTIEAASGRDFLALLPSGGDALLGLLVVPLLVQWWAVYYPGSEPGGGGYVAQRMFAARDERHARAGTLWYIVVHYALRPWPWIVTGLAALVLEPAFAGLAADGTPLPEASVRPDSEMAYPWMFRLLPAGALGLVVASFLAAYMSTITSLLNLSASYLVNDFWLPLRRSRASAADSGSAAAPPLDPRAGVAIARLTVAIVTVAGVVVTWSLDRAGAGWSLVWEFTAGTGLVLLARWLWWRVNAWSEIAAMVASVAAASLLQIDAVAAKFTGDWQRLLAVVAVTTLAWVTTTLATRPCSAGHLARFFLRVRPGGAWGPVAVAAGRPAASLRRDLVLWLAATAATYALLFACGHALFGRVAAASLCAVIALLPGAVVVKGLCRPDDP
jgi:Na+/proline symporter